MHLTPATWDEMDPATWRTAAADLRALSALDDSRSYAALARDLGYDWPTKITNMRTAARKLRDAANHGDEDAKARIRRAEDLAILITNKASERPPAIES